MIFRRPQGDPKWAAGGKGGTSGVQGILHFSLLEEVIMWVLQFQHFQCVCSPLSCD